MKRSLALCALLCLLLALSGCRAARVPGLDWDPEEMVELQLYQGAVPAGAQRKTTTDPEKIRQAAQALFSLRVEREHYPALATALRDALLSPEEYRLYYVDHTQIKEMKEG